MSRRIHFQLTNNRCPWTSRVSGLQRKTLVSGQRSKEGSEKEKSEEEIKDSAEKVIVKKLDPKLMGTTETEKLC